MDKIIAKGLKFFARHGVNPEEKEKPQRFLFDLEIGLDLSTARQSDQLKDTINYSDLVECVREQVQNRSYNLLEALAESIAESIMRRFPAEYVQVTVKKPDAPVDADFDYFAVTIEKFRQ